METRRAGAQPEDGRSDQGETAQEDSAAVKGTPDPNAPMWTIPDVAAYAGITTGTIGAYLNRGQMPAPDGRIGRTPWWHPSTIRAWR
ncbi:hypothetical protein SAMN05421595_1373 [Austwickia chelonae]|uniref:HTH merR-type domain-containing protein n=1 Tax=Austwickia chelonae NBRC 105200 TaxID=1184607 RepID=K6VQB3_9MICO|nr:hypothetical protein [Austwickia chelonae]GAB77535.1 hypothetical protein AUCHE_05_04470 [Austwickia chelonae NBRC 105200]SEW12390.1 hypothetical protein SAMN05421595_1373 [Austwickia chelonae]